MGLLDQVSAFVVRHMEALEAVIAVSPLASTIRELHPTLRAAIALGITFMAGVGVAGAILLVGLRSDMQEVLQDHRRYDERLETAQAVREDLDTRIEEVEGRTDQRLDTVICILEEQLGNPEHSASEIMEQCRPPLPW